MASPRVRARTIKRLDRWLTPEKFAKVDGDHIALGRPGVRHILCHLAHSTYRAFRGK